MVGFVLMLRRNSEQKGRNFFPRVAFVPGRRGRPHACARMCSQSSGGGVRDSGGVWRSVMGVWGKAQWDTHEQPSTHAHRTQHLL